MNPEPISNLYPDYIATSFVTWDDIDPSDVSNDPKYNKRQKDHVVRSEVKVDKQQEVAKIIGKLKMRKGE